MYLQGPVPRALRVQVKNIREIDFDDPVIIETLISAFAAILVLCHPITPDDTALDGQLEVVED